MMQKMKKISLMACSLFAVTAMVGGLYAISTTQEVVAEGAVAKYVSTDTETKSAWESAGYGTDGYFVMGANASNKAAAYSNMYTEQGNDGKTEIAMNKANDNTWWYDAAKTISFDSAAPISKFVLNGSSIWQNGNQSKVSYLYIPGTETTYPGRIHNNMTSVYRDFGLGFTLRETETTHVTAYIADWEGRASESLPITVGLYSGIKTATTQGYSASPIVKDKTIESHYGVALAETTITTGAGAYVTFEIEGAGDYQIVAYYDNQNVEENSRVAPMFLGLFFDKPAAEEEPEVPEVPGEPAEITETVFMDTTSKSAWEANGYGTDGYLVLGGQKAYSDMYTEQGNNGKTEISLYRHGNNSIYYDNTQKTTDSTAPISGFVVNGSAAWQDGSPYTATGGHFANQPNLYIPGTETEYPTRLHNNHNNDPYCDLGLGFTLRETGKIYVTAYVLDWAKKVSTTNPITVGLFKNIQAGTSWGYDGDQDVFEQHYGTALVETTVTSQGAYVTFAVEGKGNYQIVAYYKNSDITKASPVTPMMTGLFFDKEIYPEVTSTSLSLEGDIGVNYYVGARGQDLTNTYMKVEYSNGNVERVPASIKNADGTYKYQVKVAAKDYAGTMKMRLYNEEGMPVSREFEYSAASYVQTILNAGASVYGEKLVALATALDDYGKAAANLFYGENNTFAGNVSVVTLDTLSAYQFSMAGSVPAGVTITDFSLSLKSTTSLKVYFTATSLSGIVCKVGDTVVTPITTGAANEYCIVIENITAKDLDTNYVVNIGGCELTLNTLSYAFRALEYSSDANLKVAMQALYLYNQAANEYFETGV